MAGTLIHRCMTLLRFSMTASALLTSPWLLTSCEVPGFSLALSAEQTPWLHSQLNVKLSTVLMYVIKFTFDPSIILYNHLFLNQNQLKTVNYYETLYCFL